MICSHQNLRAYTHTKLAPLFFDTFLVSMRILLIWNKNMVSSHDGRYHFRANTFKTTRATSSAIFVCKDENPTVHCSSVETSSRNSCKELALLSDFYAILRFFRLYDSSDCYSPIFPILRVVRDSSIFPIIRFFRFFWCSEFYTSLRFFRLCDSSDFYSPIFPISLSTTRFSDFSDYTFLPIFRFSEFYAILPFSDCPPILPIFPFRWFF